MDLAEFNLIVSATVYTINEKQGKQKLLSIPKTERWKSRIEEKMLKARKEVFTLNG